MSESTVPEVGSRMSMRRLWVRISNCSRESLLMCGERITVYRLRSVGRGQDRKREHRSSERSRR